MADRFRALFDRPLGPSAAQAILVFASAILVGFAALFVLAGGQADQPAPPHHPPASAASPDPVATAAPAEADQAKRPAPPRRQDPQDIKGSALSRRAARALRSHRALQHVPYRDGEVRVVLAGARGRRAVLRVSAPTFREARRGWRRFLRHFRDSGGAYLPRFAVGAKGAAG